jgi:hypothetical protein
VAQATGAQFIEANVVMEIDAARTIAVAAKFNGGSMYWSTTSVER